MLEEDKELASLARERKRGKWSDEEKEHLINLTRNRRRIDIESIARQIGRESNDIRYRLRLMAKEKSVELGNDAVSFSKAFLESDLGKEEQSVLERRMCRVIDGLLRERDTTARWRAILSAKSTETWAATILPLIPTQVKHMLAAPSPPTAADWRTLAWQDTSLFGIYAWVLKRGRGAGLNPLRVENYVYIGSATKYAHGLSGRALQHRKGHYRDGPMLNSRIKQRGLGRTTGHFATLLTMEAASSEIGDITKARELVVFAEAIFTIWFGALTGTESASMTGRAEKHHHLHTISPWDHPQQFNYKGLCSHNPLILDLKFGQESAHPPEDTDPGQSGPVVDNMATEN
jgi:transposase-like protein